MELIYIVKEDDTYKTVNDILSLEFDISSRLKNKLIKQKNIFKNKIVTDTRNFVSPNDTIVVNLNQEEENSNIVPTKMDLKIIYEDEWFLVIDKPSGIAIHPSVLHYNNSLSNGIKFYFDSIGLKKKIRPVNRLDLDTSGLVIFSKCEYIQEQFSKQMAKGIFKKEYLCLVEGILDSKKGVINLPISRKPNSIIERCVDSNGKKSITHYEVLKEFKNYSLVKCKLETGKTHQIRVHMKAIGHPILGDTLYGKPSPLVNRQALHSYKIKCIHPVTKKELIFTCDFPKKI